MCSLGTSSSLASRQGNRPNKAVCRGISMPICSSYVPVHVQWNFVQPSFPSPGSPSCSSLPPPCRFLIGIEFGQPGQPASHPCSYTVQPHPRPVRGQRVASPASSCFCIARTNMEVKKKSRGKQKAANSFFSPCAVYTPSQPSRHPVSFPGHPLARLPTPQPLSRRKRK
ncbi:hypothetical protein GQ53DRAFT_230384 [Thozetella sp. PMI_491]|nr:hypothetical protein GQ53DRAFT_230384 [Thozetella sp. PMI_491]